MNLSPALDTPVDLFPEEHSVNDTHQYVICYDTPDDKRRRRMVAILEEHCERVQWSVFEGWLQPKQFDQLWSRLEWMIEPAQDNLRSFRLCTYCQADLHILGVGKQTEAVRYWIC